MSKQRLNIAAAQAVVELEAETAQLDRDVGVKRVSLYAREHVLMTSRNRPRLLRRSDLLTEQVDRGQLSLTVQPSNDMRGIIE